MSVQRAVMPTTAAALTLGAAFLRVPSVEGLLLGLLINSLVELIVPAVWGTSYLLTGDFWPHGVAAACWLVVAMGAVPGETTAVISACIVCGLSLGWALRMQWRRDPPSGDCRM